MRSASSLLITVCTPRLHLLLVVHALLMSLFVALLIRTEVV